MIREQTFSKEFAFGTLGHSLQEVASHPFMRVAATPFFRTPMRLAEYSTVHTPGLNLIAKQFWSDVSAGGAKADLAFGKLAVGAGLVFAVAQAAQDGYITGSGPKDKALRTRLIEAGWQPKSLYNPINGRYYSYDNIEPISSIVATAADFVAISSEMPDNGIGELFMAASISIAHNAVAKQWWQPISDLLDVADTFGKGGDEAARQAMKYLSNRANALTPGAGLLRTVRQTIDQEQREPGKAVREDDPLWAEVRVLYEYWANQVPGFSDSVPARKNMITGEPILYEGVFGDSAIAAGLSPFRVTTNAGDPVLNEIIIQKGAGLPVEVPRVIGGTRPPDGIRVSEPSRKEGVLLSEPQRTRLTEILTSEVKDASGLTLHQALTSLVTETGPYAVERYKSAYSEDGKDSARALMIYRIWRFFIGQAEDRLLQEDKTLGEQVRRRKIERELGKLPDATREAIRPMLR